MKDYEDVDDLYKVLSETLNNAYDRGYEKGRGDKPIVLADETAYMRGLGDAWDVARKIIDMWFNYFKHDANKFDKFWGLNGKLNDDVFKLFFEQYSASDARLKLAAYEAEQEDTSVTWHDMPTDQMNEEQLRQAVKELRKALSERM